MSIDFRELKKKNKLGKEMKDLQMWLEHAYSRTCFGEDDGFFQYLINNYHAIVPFEKPDMYILSGKNVIGIEHFQFDAYSRVKGSSGKQEVAEAHREMDQEASTLSHANDGKHLSRSIQSEESIENYEQNSLYGFNKHYDKIGMFRRNLKEAVPEQEGIKICFLVEDASPFGNHISSKEGIGLLVPLMIQSFANRIKEADKVDYLIFYTKDDYKGKLYFYQNCVGNHELLVDFFDSKKETFCTHEGAQVMCSYYSLVNEGECESI